MAKEFFKNLPDTSTPITASRINGLLNGEEAMGSIVVDDISCKNKLNEDNPTNSTVNWSGSGSTHYFTADNSWEYLEWLFDVKVGEEYTFSYKDRNSDNLYLYIAEIDTSGTVLRTIVSDGTNIKYSFTIQNNSILRVRFMNNAIVSNVLCEELQLEKGSTATKYTPYKKFGYNDTESMGKIVVDDVRSKNLYNYATSIIGYAVDKTGTLVVSEIACASDYIDVEGMSNLIVSNSTIDFNSGCCFYTSDKTFISGFSADQMRAGVSVPSNAKYIRINSFITDRENVQLEQGTVASSFTQYKNFNAPYFQDLTNEIVYNSAITGTKNFALYKYGNVLCLQGYIDESNITTDTALLTIPTKYLNGVIGNIYGAFALTGNNLARVVINSHGAFSTKANATFISGCLTWIIKEDTTSTSSASTTSEASTSSTMSLRPDMEEETTSLEENEVA